MPTPPGVGEPFRPAKARVGWNSRTAPESTPLRGPTSSSRPSLQIRLLESTAFAAGRVLVAVTLGCRLILTLGRNPPCCFQCLDDLVGIVLQLRRLHHLADFLRRKLRPEVAPAIIRQPLVNRLPEYVDTDLPFSEDRQERPPKGGVEIRHFVGAEADLVHLAAEFDLDKSARFVCHGDLPPAIQSGPAAEAHQQCGW